MSRRLWMVEAVVALLCVVAALAVLPPGLLAEMAWASVAAVGSAADLANEDPRVVVDAGLGALRSMLVVAPAAMAFVKAHPRRLVWVPASVPWLIFAVALAPHGLFGWKMVLLALVSLAAMAAQWHPRLRFAAVAPVLLAAHPTLTTHQRAVMALPGLGSYVERRCRDNEGERPVDVRSSDFTPSYYAASIADDGHILLTGEGTSRWLFEEDGGRLRLGPRSRVDGNYWGAIGAASDDGYVWVAHRDELVAARWTEAGEDVRISSLVGVRHDAEVDVLDAVHMPELGVVFASELAQGGLLRVPDDGSSPGTRHDLDLFYLQLARGPGTELVAISTTELVTIDATDGTILTRRSASLCSGGIDTCANDWAAAVTDYAGRVRLFERTPAGGYELVGSAAAPAPRRVAFSPDCDAIAVTSADDSSVRVFDREALTVIADYRVGPGLRDITWTDRGDLLVVDACTVTRLSPLEHGEAHR